MMIMIIISKAVPLQAWSDPECSRKLRFRDFKTTAQDGGKVVSLTHRPPSPPGNAPGTHFCYRLSRPQGHSAIGRILSMKNPLTLAGIEPATFRFVAQHHNDNKRKCNHMQPYLQTTEIKSKILTWYIQVVGNAAPLLTDIKCFNDHVVLWTQPYS